MSEKEVPPRLLSTTNETIATTEDNTWVSGIFPSSPIVLGEPSTTTLTTIGKAVRFDNDDQGVTHSLKVTAGM